MSSSLEIQYAEKLLVLVFLLRRAGRRRQEHARAKPPAGPQSLSRATVQEISPGSRAGPQSLSRTGATDARNVLVLVLLRQTCILLT
jgi:hypothetical protein